MRIVPLILLALAAPPAAAQPGARTVAGRAVDADGRALAGVVVAALGGDAPPARTDAAGRFALRLPPGDATLVAARLGFSPETLHVAADAPARALTARLRHASLALDPVLVRGDAHTAGRTSASSGVVRELDLRLRPRESSADLLRLVPGVVVAQHAGGGKAEQLLVRGFDADHGTDLALSVDGTPVNLVSHAHGQGYADLHAVIPETVERLEVRKGPYDARDGDFATAGAVAFHTADRVPAALASARAGSFGARRVLGVVPLGRLDGAGGYAAASAQTGDGPFDRPQRHRRANAFAKWTAPLPRLGGAELVATLSAHAARWDASGQIPERLVDAGVIGRFGAVDSTEGGGTERHDASVALRSPAGAADGTRWEARAYAARARLRLFSDFTFFRDDSVNGDGIEQADARTLGGAEARWARAGWRAGAGVRADAARVLLAHQRARARLAPRVDARVDQRHAFAWTSRELHPHPRLRLDVGLRGDAFRFAVDDRLAGAAAAAWHGVASPKLSAALELGPAATLFADAGTGFHSNDARAVVAARRGERVLPRAAGAELGARRTWSGGSVAVALWRLDMQSELTYAGDAGTTEPLGRTRRVGADLEARARLLPWLWADADLNLARARLRDAAAGADRVPLAPRLTSAGGLTVRDGGPLAAGVRYRLVGPRPADEQGALRARGATVWEAFASRSVGRATIFASVDNLFDVAWSEAQVATTSRLRGEPRGVMDLHFIPGAGRGAQVGVEWRVGGRGGGAGRGDPGA